jgi:hypothetical protein
VYLSESKRDSREQSKDKGNGLEDINGGSNQGNDSGNKN